MGPRLPQRSKGESLLGANGWPAGCAASCLQLCQLFTATLKLPSVLLRLQATCICLADQWCFMREGDMWMRVCKVVPESLQEY